MIELSEEQRKEILEYIQDNVYMADETLLSEILTVFELEYDFEAEVLYMMLDLCPGRQGVKCE